MPSRCPLLPVANLCSLQKYEILNLRSIRSQHDVPFIFCVLILFLSSLVFFIDVVGAPAHTHSYTVTQISTWPNRSPETLARRLAY